MNIDIPANVRTAIAEIAAGRRPNASTARSKAAAPYIAERSTGLGYSTTFRLTKFGRAISAGMAAK